MKHIMSWQDLDRRSPTWYVFEGCTHEASVSMHLQATSTLGDTTLEVTAGQIVLVPTGTSHTFVYSGEGTLRQSSVHASAHRILSACRLRRSGVLHCSAASWRGWLATIYGLAGLGLLG